MKKPIIILLILIFVLGLIPNNFSFAITQNQISSEVQIVCPDNYGNWFSGSGTIIDPKGIILTNKHVVTDEKGGIINTCFIGFMASINQEPDFGTKVNPNLAEVKYYTTTDDMDAAILYLNNATDQSYPYINIWDSNSNSLKFGDKIEAIGFPSIGGSTITYTSGDFSGFGSSTDGTQNFIKTTVPLEHGNSGGAAYNPAGQFIGIPTMVVAGTLNSLSYILSIDSIKNWLSNVLGNNYEQKVIIQEPMIQKPTVNIQNDVTPPNFNNIDSLCYNIYDNNSEIGARCFQKKLGKVEGFNNLQFIVYKSEMAKIDNGGLSKIYYYFDNKPHSTLDNNAKEHLVTSYKDDRLTISDSIIINDAGKYYFSFFAVDNNNNISNPVIYEYVYEPENFKNLETLYFYKDSERNEFLNSFNLSKNDNKYDMQTWYEPWGYGANICYTKLNNLTISWEYPTKYNNYIVKKVNSYKVFPVKFTDGLKIATNMYSFNNLSLGKKVNYEEYINGTTDLSGKLQKNGIYYEFYLKPDTTVNTLEHKHRLLQIVYNANLTKDFECTTNSTFIQNGNKQVIPDVNLIDRLKGYILLQVEDGGKAWYVNPADGKRYYMKDGATAYVMMRKFGLGITNIDLAKVPQENGKNNNPTLVNKLKGKILLQVQAHGEAWYIHPKTGYRYYMKDGEVAYSLMRNYSLGITSKDLEKIPVGSL